MGCFVVAGFVLTIASRGPSAIAELLVLSTVTVNKDVYIKMKIKCMLYNSLEWYK